MGGGWFSRRGLVADRSTMWTYVLRHYARLRAAYASDVDSRQGAADDVLVG